MLILSFKHAQMIASSVFIMMLVVAYINWQSSGGWKRLFESKRWRQYLLATGWGVLPGCLGVFTVVTLYSHGRSVLVYWLLPGSPQAVMKPFIMLALLPKTAILITTILFLGALLLVYYIDSRLWKLDIHSLHFLKKRLAYVSIDHKSFHRWRQFPFIDSYWSGAYCYSDSA